MEKLLNIRSDTYHQNHHLNTWCVWCVCIFDDGLKWKFNGCTIFSGWICRNSVRLNRQYIRARLKVKVTMIRSDSFICVNVLHTVSNRNWNGIEWKLNERSHWMSIKKAINRMIQPQQNSNTVIIVRMTGKCAPQLIFRLRIFVNISGIFFWFFFFHFSGCKMWNKHLFQFHENEIGGRIFFFFSRWNRKPPIQLIN